MFGWLGEFLKKVFMVLVIVLCFAVIFYYSIPRLYVNNVIWEKVLSCGF